ncbi:RBBP9/YdeN family alpha/beta hydrolase [Staphylococcus gallinarum]|uniref:Alpha/beta hydrolase n=1 Tax=Staphylococcus gallinarum TaxID=1293 RepID=A0ABQ0Y2D8_STAGA|nr:alpha/beta hydrolase [Staphylococcus gallinarum]KIR10522.1 alpha/beta hydrolase [Staphylococcus gallinarum]MCD8902492.1 alpha/beta hydrolase [Staphylococcus gallinarum]MCD8908580.1 alpha/beta hydrolase [Staphylococcus gallinarum]MCD8919115.1 alpha/beta hydrolase [Staphylococcus gallinarum]MEB6236303.1 alpha/beta hydrolase [Staphylococcus gallinarum]
MTDIIIVHSKYGDATNHWYEWLANNLILEGYNVTLFNIPVEDRENMNTWVKRMEEQIQVQKYETYFVTHGYGTLAALKYIEKTAIGKVEGLFSISGFKEDAHDIDENIELDVSIDYKDVKSKVEQFYGLCAVDDKYVNYQETKRLMDTLGGSCKITSHGGHFLESDGFDTFNALQMKMQAIMTK